MENNNQLKDDLLKLKKLTDKIVVSMGTKTTNNKHSDMGLSEVSFSRLYKCDDEELDNICNTTMRKKSQVIRMLIHSAIKNNIGLEEEI